MVKRYLDCTFQDLKNYTKEEKLESIRASEGRTLVTEIVTSFPPLLGDVSNAFVATSFGSDILLLNLYDVDNPRIQGIEGDQPLMKVKKATDRLIGVNLEPVDEIPASDDFWKLEPGRIASLENVGKLIDQGADMVLLTGNPGTGVRNEKILETIKAVKDKYGDQIIIAAGKMHAAGSLTEAGDKLLDRDLTQKFIDAGADIVLLPAVGTIPGFDLEKAKDIISLIHENNKLAMTSVGTSQEGADIDTIKRIALLSKMAGTDIHHLGDSGLSPGVAIPENITAYSIVIKGKRHTYRRMAMRKYK